jgi:hypothetical protein
MTDKQETPLSDIQTIQEFLDNHKSKFTRPQITWLFRNRHRNGFAAEGAFLMVGRKPYINVPAFTRVITSKK